ncbi:MAG TPA: phospholipase D family protein [Dictyobacter sp.]|nr:phospholipase D family protein [Dictyobacter sp.]
MENVEARYEENSWWAQGDTPVRDQTRITYFADGRGAFLEQCRHFLAARQYIYIANWGLTPQMRLVRGTDHVGGTTDNEADRATITEGLRAAGLQEQDIAFWFQHELTVEAVLGYAVQKGVEVKVLLWKSPSAFSHYDPQEAHDRLTAVGVTCILDDSAHGIVHHPVESLHQKMTSVDGVSFVGGLDPLIEKGGDFDRWDTPDHLFDEPLRYTPEGTTPHSWHDVHAMIEGPAAGDIEANFRQRWNDVSHRHHLPDILHVPERPLPQPRTEQGLGLVQVGRTIPQHTYHFEPEIARGIDQFYEHGIHNAQRFVYLENQYLWLHAFYGIDLPFMGQDSTEMERILHEIEEALHRGAFMSIVLPDHPNVGRAYSDAALTRLRTADPQAEEEGRLQAFTLATSGMIEGEMHYRPIYIHAKVGIVDDVWSTVGSGNLNNRGMRDDTEINVATVNPELAHGLRLLLQGEHLGLLHNNDSLAISRLLGQQYQPAAAVKRAREQLHYLEEQLGDPMTAHQLMHRTAWANLGRYKKKQPLVGHILPYLRAEEAEQQRLNFHEELGWLEESTRDTEQ